MTGLLALTPDARGDSEPAPAAGTHASVWERHHGLLRVQMSGIDRVDDLMKQGRTEDARDHLISTARAVWQYRWPTRREYTMRRLGESLDTNRFPELAPIATDLRREAPDSARRFLDYLRQRTHPDAGSFVARPAAPPPDFVPEGQSALALWQAAAATNDPAIRAALDRRIAEYLDPHVVITWHETAGGYPRLVMSALAHGGLDDRTLCQLILFGLDHAEQCNDTAHLTNPPQTSIGGNHLFAWISAWLKFTILFPEFRRTPALQAAALARLDDEVSKQVMPDGSMIEGVPGYQNCCLFGASEFLGLCAQYRLPLPDRVREAWERMLRFNIGLMRPDFCIPFLGDSHDQLVPNYIWRMKEFYAFPELEWTVSRGAAGRPPAFTSVGFPSIGYYVLRGGWQSDDLYLCFDGGRFGQAHQHEDKLHMELWAHGRLFLVDPGDYGYTDHWMREWVVLSQAHNTVLVDGAGQCRWREDRDRWYSAAPLENPWRTGPEWDVVEACFDGPFERDVGGVRVRRRVAFHKGDPACYWVTDWIEGAGRHEATELFHFAHDIAAVDEIPGGVRTRIAGGPDFAVLLARPAGADADTPPVSVRRHRAERNPTRGWVAPRLYEVEPAWEVHFTGAGDLPLRRDFILLPSKTALPDDLQATLDLSGPAPAINLAIGGRRSRFISPLAP